MAIDTLQMLGVIEVMENFIARKRPPANIRHQLELSYKIEGQSIIVYDVRPAWNSQGEKIESNIAKATFLKAKNHWKIFWQRSDLNFLSLLNSGQPGLTELGIPVLRQTLNDTTS